MSITIDPPAVRRQIASQHLANAKSSSISRVMGTVAKLRAAGGNIVGMHVGEPDFDTPAHIRAAGLAAIENGDTHYTAFDGSPALKSAVQAKYAKVGLEFDHSEIVAGNGSKLLLFAAFLATLEPGDEVVLPAPYWTSYIDIIRMMLAVPVVIETTPEDGFLLQPEALEAAITDRTRWVMFNSPSNPSGAVYQREDYEKVLDVVARHDHVWVLADDMYEHIVFDDTAFVTPLEVRPDLRDRTVTINGVSKAYAMTGWRIGYAVGPREVIQMVGAVLSQSTSCASSISQAAAVEALTGPQDCLDVFNDAYSTRRSLVLELLSAIPEVSCVPPRGAFYAFVDWRHYRGAVTPSGTVLTDDESLCRYLLDDYGFATIPGSAFGSEGFVRLSFACSSETIVTGLGLFRTALAALS